MKRIKVIAIAALLLVLPVIRARGELITFAFQGTVTSVDIDSRVQSFEFPRIGDPFSGFYSFDSSVPSGSGSPDEGRFHFPPPKGAVSASIGDFQFFGPSMSILMSSNIYAVGSYFPSIELTSDAELAEILNRVGFQMEIRRANLFDDPTVLPLEPPSLDGADQATLVMLMDSSTNTRPGQWVVIVASLDSLVRVPEPSSGLILEVCILLYTGYQLRSRTAKSRECCDHDSQTT